MHQLHLTRTFTFDTTDDTHKFAFFGELHNACVNVPIRDVDVAVGPEEGSGRAVECVMRSIIPGNAWRAEGQDDLSIRVKLEVLA